MNKKKGKMKKGKRKKNEWKKGKKERKRITKRGKNKAKRKKGILKKGKKRKKERKTKEREGEKKEEKEGKKKEKNLLKGNKGYGEVATCNINGRSCRVIHFHYQNLQTKFSIKKHFFSYYSLYNVSWKICKSPFPLKKKSAILLN